MCIGCFQQNPFLLKPYVVYKPGDQGTRSDRVSFRVIVPSATAQLEQVRTCPQDHSQISVPLLFPQEKAVRKTWGRDSFIQRLSVKFFYPEDKC